MLKFNIRPVDRTMEPAIKEKIDNLTKPKGSLGRLEELACKIALIQQTLFPELRQPHNVLFAADHGILEEGVSVSPKEVTWQQLSHFSKGGAGINFLCEQHNFKLVLVDAGVDYDIPAGHGIIDMKVRKGTRNFLHGPAMTKEELDLCVEHGAQVVRDLKKDTDCNVISFGEMGSGNTSPSAIWMHLFTDIDLEKCIGAGAGLDTPGIKHKYEVLSQSVANYTGDDPQILDYAVFGHQGDESGHKRMLDAMGVKAILHLDLRLGEGSGAVCAYPIVESAVRMINGMDSFQSVNVTKYF